MEVFLRNVVCALLAKDYVGMCKLVLCGRNYIIVYIICLCYNIVVILPFKCILDGCCIS